MEQPLSKSWLVLWQREKGPGVLKAPTQMGSIYFHAHFIDQSQPHYVAKLEAHKKGHALFPELINIIYNRWRNEVEVNVNIDYDRGKEPWRAVIMLRFLEGFFKSSESRGVSICTKGRTLVRELRRLHEPHGSWDSSGKNTGVGCHALLQGIFPTQGSNPRLLHCGQILHHWATREAHSINSMEWSRKLPTSIKLIVCFCPMPFP